MIITPEGVRRKRVAEMTPEEQIRVRESNRDNARRNRAMVRQQHDSEKGRLDVLTQRYVALREQADCWKQRLAELQALAEQRFRPQ